MLPGVASVVKFFRIAIPTICFLGPAPIFFLIWLSIRLLTWISASPKLYRRYDDYMYSVYQQFTIFFFESWVNVKIYFHGDYEEIIKRKENVLYLSNHQSSVDWAVADMLAIRQGSVGHIRYVLKHDLRWIPLIGFYFHQHGCIFVRRNDKGDLDRVEKGIRQIKSNGLPVWLVIFPEGTRYNPKTNKNAIERSREFAQQKGVPPFDKVLYPRTGATIAAINALKDKLDAVYDVTIMYGKNRLAAPSMFEYLMGQIDELHVHVARIPINSVPSETNEQISNWLYQRFVAKDKLLKDFPSQTGVQAQRILNSTIFSCLFFIFFIFLFFFTSQGRSFYWQLCLVILPITYLWLHLFPPTKMIDAPNSEDDDTCVPRAAVYKMIKDCTQHIRVSGEAKEMFVQCCNEFIHTLALQANTVCEQQTKKLVHPDHIVTALDNLGFGSYKTNCLNAMETAQEELAQKRRKHHGKLTSIYTDEDLRQQQELLFQQAREEAQQLEDDDWARTQELSKEILKKKIDATRTDDDNYDD